MKRLFMLSLMIFTIFVLTSCHGNLVINDFEMPAEFDMNKQYEITFWAKNDTNIYQRKIYQDAVKEFNKYYPNITVKLDDTYTDYNAIYQDVLKNISTNTTPNVCITYIDHVATYNAGGDIVLPLDEFITDPSFGFGGSKVNFQSVKVEDIYKNYLDEGIYNGKYYTIPFMRSSEVLYVNVDYIKWLYDDPNYEIREELTWDEVFEICELAYEKRSQGLSPYKTLETEEDIEADLQKFFPFIYKSADNLLISMLKQKNYPYSDEKGNIYMFNEQTKELLNYLADLQERKLFNIFNIVSYPGNHFNLGNCIFAVDSTAGSTWMGSDAPLSEVAKDNAISFETEVRMLPQFDLNNEWMISQGPSLCIFNKSNSDEVLASWLFANFLLTDYVQIRYSQTEGYIPVTKSAVNNVSYQTYLDFKIGDDTSIFDNLISDKDLYDLTNEKDLNNYFYDVKLKTAKLSTSIVEKTFMTPAFKGSIGLRNAAAKVIELTIREASTKNTVDDKFLNDLYDRMIQLYKLELEPQENNISLEQEKLKSSGKVLLIVLGVVWVLIGTSTIIGFVMKKHRERKLLQ